MNTRVKTCDVTFKQNAHAYSRQYTSIILARYPFQFLFSLHASEIKIPVPATGIECCVFI
jgi:hypothetical protein